MKKISTFFLVAILAACSTVGTGKISNLSKIKSDPAFANMTKKEVVERLGEPQNKFIKDGKEVYEYKYVKVYNNPASYPPLIGLFFKHNRYTMKYLYVHFNESDKVAYLDSVQQSGAFPPEDILKFTGR